MHWSHATTRSEDRFDSVADKLRRLDLDLAPEDATEGQAANTARLRNDPAYLDAWREAHLGMEGG